MNQLKFRGISTFLFIGYFVSDKDTRHQPFVCVFFKFSKKKSDEISIFTNRHVQK